MDSGTSRFEVAGTYKGWTILLALACNAFEGVAHYRARIQAAGGEPIDVSTNAICCHAPIQGRSRAIAHARSFIDALGVHGDGTLCIGFPARSDYRHPVGVYFPVVNADLNLTHGSVLHRRRHRGGGRRGAPCTHHQRVP